MGDELEEAGVTIATLVQHLHQMQTAETATAGESALSVLL